MVATTTGPTGSRSPYQVGGRRILGPRGRRDGHGRIRHLCEGRDLRMVVHESFRVPPREHGEVLGDVAPFHRSNRCVVMNAL